MLATSPPKLPAGSSLNVTPEILPGTLLAGKYRAESVLARGGMGMVIAACHEQLGHRVAIKVLLPGLLDASSTRRVLREARALAALRSDHVTRVLDVGELDTGAPFIVMELLEGADLSDIVKREGPLPLSTVAGYLVQACDAISEAHSAGIVHRDLKPSNLFVTRRRDGSPLVKLLDFGISKPVLPAGDETQTTTHSVSGTPEFMSPEQFVSGGVVDTRSDIWALGVVLYRLLTGERMFGKQRAPALEIGIGALAVPKLRDRLPDAPQEVEDLILRCLEPKREARLQSVEEFVARLLPFADAPTRERFQHLSTPARSSTEVTLRAEPRTRRRRAVVVLGALLVLVAGGFVLGLRTETGPSPVAPATARPVILKPELEPVNAPDPPAPTAPSISASAPAEPASPRPGTRRSAPRPDETKQPRDPYGSRR